ncbi:MAG: hypothetical protein ACPHP9_08935, partial [bacterium]
DHLLSDEVPKSPPISENPTPEPVSPVPPLQSADQKTLPETRPEAGQNLTNTSKSSTTTEVSKTNESVAATQVMDMLK